MARYRKKPVVIEARQFKSTNYDHIRELVDWINAESGEEKAFQDSVDIWIDTLEGAHKVIRGDWIIKGVAGEFYACKPDIFSATYEKEQDGE